MNFEQAAVSDERPAFSRATNSLEGQMDAVRRKWVGVAVLAGVVGLAGGCAMMRGDGAHHTHKVSLSGANEVPPVSTGASGSGTVSVHPDGMVSVTVRVSGMAATAAHIHEGAAGTNGPVIVPLNKQGDDMFVSAPGAKMTESRRIPAARSARS